MKLESLLLTNYMPYAKATIVSRAIPAIDGLKPVQRRSLYIMKDMHLDGTENAKCLRINGQVVRLHPHGDSSIYDAIVLMSTGYDGLNVPYVRSKGSFGKVYSRDLMQAFPRYTEARLEPICDELFDGLKENAVDMVDNFDGSEKEPTLLPVKFPNILVNTNSGVAVGFSSNIPSFSLKNVCTATKEVIQGKIKTPKDLSLVLGVPEFTTGGYVHANEEMLEKLCETGRGSFIISGQVERYSNKIIINEIPYNTTAEDIMDAIADRIKDGTIKGIKNVFDEIGLEGLRLVIEIKNGYTSSEVLNQLRRLTPLRTSISFRTRVIIDNRCKEIGIFDLLNTWIDFRRNTIKRIYEFRLGKYSDREHLLSTWEKIKGNVQAVAQLITSNTEEVAKALLMKNYGLDEEQVEYLLEMKVRSLTNDRANRSLKELAEVRENIANVKKVVSDDKEKDRIIIQDMDNIIAKYAKDNKTNKADALTEEDFKAPEVKISEETVTVLLTRSGYTKRLVSISELNNITTDNKYYGEDIIRRWVIKNNEHILVFDRFGTVHKLLVDNIDSSRGGLKEMLYQKAGIEKPEDMIWADSCGDYTGYFNLVFPNGRGTRVHYSRAIGKRTQYTGLYDEVAPRRYWITQEDKFFMVTSRNKASYCDLSLLGVVVRNRSAFKVARVASGDYFTRLVNWKDVPYQHMINLDKYNKDYTVSIGTDRLFITEEMLKQDEENRRIRYQMMHNYDNAEANDDNNENLEAPVDGSQEASTKTETT